MEVLGFQGIFERSRKPSSTTEQVDMKWMVVQRFCFRTPQLHPACKDGPVCFGKTIYILRVQEANLRHEHLAPETFRAPRTEANRAKEQVLERSKAQVEAGLVICLTAAEDYILGG